MLEITVLPRYIKELVKLYGLVVFLKITICKTGRRFYNPLDFAPFEFLQADVKEVIDGDTLPKETYLHLKDLAKKVCLCISTRQLMCARE